VETSGYVGAAAVITGTNACGIGPYTSGAGLIGTNIASARSGTLVISNVNSTRWIINGIITNDETGFMGTTSSIKTLSGTLDRVRITTVNGTDAFDAGEANILYEG
jgi:hypothetical protein